MKTNVYARPKKPRFIEVKDRSSKDINLKALENHATLCAPLEVCAATECHVTPPDAALRMVDYLGPEKTDFILEPHAGTGVLLDAVIQYGEIDPANITAVERNIDLVQYLRKQKRFEGLEIKRDCFLDFSDFTEKRFSRIILNPPFRKIKDHMKAAFSLLEKNGVLVAIVPITYKNKNAEELEILTSGTFAIAKVTTKIIRINKE